MAKRSAQDTAAAKAKKQKIILIVGGVLLLALAAFQGPKLMKHGGSAAAPPPAAAPSATGTPVPAAVTAAPVKGSAVVAGVALPRAAAVKVETSQLASFTLFEVKDPFVQQVGSESAADAARTSGRSGRRLDGTERVVAARLHRLGARRDRDSRRPRRHRSSTPRSTSTRSRSRWRSRARSRRPSRCSSSAR